MKLMTIEKIAIKNIVSHKYINIYIWTVINMLKFK